MSQRPKEEKTYVEMRRNVRKEVKLKFRHYELRIKAQCETDDRPIFESIMPLIKIKRLKRLFIREEILYDLRKIKGIRNADLEIEVFAVYGTETYPGEYKRYLGELQFFMSGIDKYEQTTYRYKNSLSYIRKPGHTGSIPERI